MKAHNNGWTAQRKAKQSAMIHEWRPWEHSTGAKTQQGKDKSKMNARRITAMGLYRRSCQLCFFRRQWEKNGYCLPPELEARYKAFTLENDAWLANAPMKSSKKPY
ncbi:transposase [uncultured Thiomicrorhabdus sp.]